MKYVAVAIIKKEEEGVEKYLLVSSRKLTETHGTELFYPPGGHMEEGEMIEQTLMRELAEELGVHVIPGRCIATVGADVPDQVTYCVECDMHGSDITPDSEEILSWGFFSQEEMSTLPLWPTTRKFFDEYIF